MSAAEYRSWGGGEVSPRLEERRLKEKPRRPEPIEESSEQLVIELVLELLATLSEE